MSLNSFLYDDKEYLSFAIERSVARRKSYQFEWGIKIFDGTTLSNYDFSTGETISVPRIANGVFFKFSSRLYSSGMQPRHFKMDPSVFRGFYIEPELVIGFYKRNVSNRAAFSTPFSSVPPPLNASLFVLESVNYQGVMVNFGRQGVVENLALIDVSLGIGVVKENLEPVKS